MVALKASLALPSLSKGGSSRSSSPAPSPATTNVPVTDPAVPAPPAPKRTLSMLDALPRARSKSGEGKSRTATLSPATPAVAAASANGSAGPAAGLQPTVSASSALKPRLSSLLSGRSTPVPSGPASPVVPGVSALGTVLAGQAGTPAPTPAPPHAPAGGGAVAISSLEASYVTKIGMSLNDAVNKVFPSASGNLAAAAVGGNLGSNHMNDAALVAYNGLCAPRVDRAREIGQMITHELHLAIADQYLLRSLLRSAVLKTLSIFFSRLESLMVSPISDPSLLTVARTVKEAEHPPVSQKYSFMILRAAWELKRGLMRACAPIVDPVTGKEEQMPRFVKDMLAPWISKLDLLAGKIWNPILAAIKEEVVKCVTVQGAQEARVTPPAVNAPLPHSGAIAGAASVRALSLTRASTGLANHASAASTLDTLPAYLRDLSALLAATSRTFSWLSTSDADHHQWRAQIGSTVIWKMLLVISSRRVEGFGGTVIQRRGSPPLGAVSSSAAAAAPVVPRRSMSSMGMGRLRPASASGKRSPSPPPPAALSVQEMKLIAEVEAFESILEKFVSSLLPSPSSTWDGHAIDTAGDHNAIPCSKKKECPTCRGRYIPLDLDDSDDEEALPREAMQEAMAALSSFIVILRSFSSIPSSASAVGLTGTLIQAISAVDDIRLAPQICPNLVRALDTVPPLILIQELVSRVPVYYGLRFPHELWGATWREFEKTMRGFHAGDEWVGEVGWELLNEARRVRKELAKQMNLDPMLAKDEEVDPDGWLELLRKAVTDLAEVDDDEEGGSAVSLRAGDEPPRH